ncbi:hypothetical protein DIPPA_32314 [Diplonema papillatum]|nr:hypothetical protein DIPPA_32314 [Diplonema papillatum]
MLSLGLVQAQRLHQAPQKKEEGTPCRNTVFVCPHAATRSAIAKVLLAEPGLVVKEQDQVTLLLWADSEEHDAPLQAFLRTLDVLDLCVQVAVPFRLGKKKRKVHAHTACWSALDGGIRHRAVVRETVGKGREELLFKVPPAQATRVPR